MTYDSLDKIIRKFQRSEGLTYRQAQDEFRKDNRYNKGVEKILDDYFKVLTLKNGTKIYAQKNGRIVAQTKTGKFRSTKGLERFIRAYKQKNKRK